MAKDQLATLRKTWDRLHKIPGGRKAFSKFVGRMAPYTGSVDPQVLDLRRGYARVKIKDQKKVRNHLRSIHAIALMNLAEVSSGLAFSYSLPPKSRAILTGLSIEYVKKARGTLVAECSLEPPESNERAEHEIEVVTKDASGEVVTIAKAKWLVSPLS